MEIPIEWTSLLEVEDWNFIKRFVISSGSLKEMAKYYNVTYPTMRLKLDRLIQKIKLSENTKEDSLITMIKNLAIDDKIEYNAAKTLINEYRNKIGGGKND